MMTKIASYPGKNNSLKHTNSFKNLSNEKNVVQVQKNESQQEQSQEVNLDLDWRYEELDNVKAPPESPMKGTDYGNGFNFAD